MKTGFKLDGTAYPNVHVISLKRSFSVLDGPNAGRVMTGAMVRDIIGTYYNYSMEINPDGSSPEEYDQLYEALSAPVDSHMLEVPYGRQALTFQAYVANGEDALLDMAQTNRWTNLSINFVAVAPQRRPL